MAISKTDVRKQVQEVNDNFTLTGTIGSRKEIEIELKVNHSASGYSIAYIPVDKGEHGHVESYCSSGGLSSREAYQFARGYRQALKDS